uniref:Uncharacterized protein n=1 Tax=Phaeomonas parva TaxID=124430 RepID=A0A7S1TUN4_9STRA|mmetsp:Transcript_17752/g.54297  ORF Transcript_17752/g.54297 Transcript_17752/m.54297 type:complete len:491 (+) Transcript_17752:347-1819(+)
MVLLVPQGAAPGDPAGIGSGNPAGEGNASAAAYADGARDGTAAWAAADNSSAAASFISVASVDGSVSDFLNLGDGLLRERSKRWREQATVEVTPNTCPSALYIAQKEWAVCSRDSPVAHLGSDDATTCHFIYLSSADGSRVGLSHVDSTAVENVEPLLDSLIDELRDETESDYKALPACGRKMSIDYTDCERPDTPEDTLLHCCIVGGYAGKEGDEVSLALLQALAQRDEHIVLHLCCVSIVNSCIWSSIDGKDPASVVRDPRILPANSVVGPAVTGCVWDLKAWQEGIRTVGMPAAPSSPEGWRNAPPRDRANTAMECDDAEVGLDASASAPAEGGASVQLWPIELLPKPASYADDYRGPATQLRGCRCMNSEDWGRCYAEAYDEAQGRTVGRVLVEPFPIPRWPNISQFLRLPDEELLDFMSTSPRLEQERFTVDIRRLMQFVLEYGDGNPERPNQRVFPQERALIFSYPDKYLEQGLGSDQVASSGR